MGMWLLFEGLQMFGPRNLVEANVSMNEESGCDKKVGEVPEEMMLAKKLHTKGTLRYFATFKVQSRTTPQDMGRRSLHAISYTGKEEHRLQTTRKFSQRNKH